MVIFGAGGHASEIYDIWLRDQVSFLNEICFYDEVNPIAHKFGREVLQSPDKLKTYLAKYPDYVVAVGNPKLRYKLDELGKQMGGKLQQVIAESAHISPLDVQLGPGVNIMHQVLVSPNTIIGRLALINANAMVHHDCQIGEYSEIGPATVLTGGVRIGGFVRLGAGCVVLPGVSIADNVIVGAGTTVVRDITEPGVYVGAAHRKST